MIFDAWVIKPGKKDKLKRYYDDDNALCLTKNTDTVNVNYFSGKKYFNKSTKDICSFIIFVTQVKEIRPEFYENGIDDYESKEKIYNVESDDCQNFQPITNIIRGKKTNQEFEKIRVKYIDSPINIYHVVFYCI